ncbi:hypothetical protein OHA21_22635 [Actinoplanes sp. NBC_00393]|uniref:hypothetical protein n=1 Tax=Actinoplanes sp. NBC_00393 TaxID=2975953 RepID=UPI002E20FDCA
MTIALAQRPATDPPPRVSVLRRFGQLRQTSPGRLQLLLVTLLVLSVLTGLVAGLTATSAATGTADLRDRAQPLLVEAETVYSALADADTTAAQAFLAGGLEPVRLTERYEADLARATTALTSAAQRTPEGSEAASAVQALAAGTARYAALVATARAVNRQGLPVGASYLATASELNRETLQPQAKALLQFAEREVRTGYEEARSSWWLILLLVLIVALVIALLRTQTYLSATTRRTFNIPLVAATALTAMLVLTCWAVFSNQRDNLGYAESDGSAPIAALTDVRILVLRERADEALTLAARSGAGPHEEDFQAARQMLTFDDPALDDVGELMDQARDQHERYVQLHEEIRAKDDGGDYDGAVELAVGQTTSSAFQVLTATIDDAMADRKGVFETHIQAAGWGFGTLIILGPLLALAVGVLAVFGLRPRLEEYR